MVPRVHNVLLMVHCVLKGVYLINNAGAIAGRRSYTEVIWPFHIVDLNCTGNERTVWDCPHNRLFGDYRCSPSNDASVRCQGLVIIMQECMHVQ